jgi:O-antigen biosynthesis protein
MRYRASVEVDGDPFEHHLHGGWRLLASLHPLFDARWYLGRNPDVRHAGADPWTHFVLHGWSEGRDPGPLFSIRYYRRHNPALDPDDDPLRDYVEGGWKRGRSPHPLFDPLHYLRTSPDVAAANVEPLAHFLDHGLSEGRTPSDIVDLGWYSSCHDVDEPLSDLIRHPAARRHRLSRWTEKFSSGAIEVPRQSLECFDPW